MPKKTGVDPEEPMLRIAMKESDFKDLLDQLETDQWDHPVFWRLRTKWSEHTRAKAKDSARTATPRKRAAKAVAV